MNEFWRKPWLTNVIHNSWNFHLIWNCWLLSITSRNKIDIQTNIQILIIFYVFKEDFKQTIFLHIECFLRRFHINVLSLQNIMLHIFRDSRFINLTYLLFYYYISLIKNEIYMLRILNGHINRSRLS